MNNVKLSKLILVVEDDPGIRVLETELIEDHGHEVVHAADGKLALQWLASHQPNLMLLDYSLPDMTGIELLDQLSSANLATPPFIVTTGAGDEYIAVDLMQRGAQNYLVKNQDFLKRLPLAINQALHNLDLEQRLREAESQQKHAEQELRKYKDHLEEEVETRTAALVLARDAAEAANKAKSTFLTSMNHELRTPLNAILGFSSLMRQDASLTEAQTANLDIINRSGAHLLTLINDILEIAKIEAGKTQLNIAPFDLGALVRDVTDMMELRAGAKGLQLLLDQSSEFPHYINGDEARLRQIFINLLGNAVKFTQQGGVTLRLRTKQNSHSHLIIEIEDSGSGLSVEDQQRLFQPFVQFGKQPGDNKGTGLGLSITRQFVQLMGGTISVESTVGKGSLFRVDLPLNEVKEPALLPQRETEKGEVIGLAPNQLIYRILIVEDQRENHLLLSQLMQRLGFEVKLANDGKQGVQLFQSWQPHLIFMDRRMPKMDGMEATQAIRKLPDGNAVKIVAVTASAFTEQRDEMMAAGMDDFVSKPYRFGEIYESLGRQLGVQYAYAQVRDNAEQSPPVALTAAMLAVLPAELRSELHDALESLDDHRISAAIQRVAPLDAQLHNLLSQLAGRFDYPAILKALQIYQPKDAA